MIISDGNYSSTNTKSPIHHQIGALTREGRHALTHFPRPHGRGAIGGVLPALSAGCERTLARSLGFADRWRQLRAPHQSHRGRQQGASDWTEAGETSRKCHTHALKPSHFTSLTHDSLRPQIGMFQMSVGDVGPRTMDTDNG